MSPLLRASFILFFAVFSIRLFGQIPADTPIKTVRISGRVVDPRNAGVPNTRVILKAVGGDQIIAEVRTDENGTFTVPAVAARAYELHFQAPGFELAIRQAARAAAGGDLDAGLIGLRVGEEHYNVPYFVPPKAQSTPNSPIRTTLCELIKQADRFHGEFVEVRSEVHPNG